MDAQDLAFLNRGGPSPWGIPKARGAPCRAGRFSKRPAGLSPEGTAGILAHSPLGRVALPPTKSQAKGQAVMRQETTPRFLRWGLRLPWGFCPNRRLPFSPEPGRPKAMPPHQQERYQPPLPTHARPARPSLCPPHSIPERDGWQRKGRRQTVRDPQSSASSPPKHAPRQVATPWRVVFPCHSLEWLSWGKAGVFTQTLGTEW